MIFHRSNYEDIRKYYQSNIIKLPALSGDRLWQILSITPDEIKLSDVDGFEIYIDLNEEYEVDYPLPARTVYQHQDRACVLVRRPAKQYYRGLHKENTLVSYFNGSGELQAMPWNIHTLQQFVDKPAYQDPHTINKEEGISWALNKYMALCSSGRISVLGKTVAIYNWHEKSVMCVNDLFKPELKQVFQGMEVA